jgi:hypothetical protein
MRIAVLTIGLMLNIGLFIQAVLGSALGDAANDDELAGAAAVDGLMALIWLMPVVW